MYQTLRQIARIGMRTENAPGAAPDDVVVRRLHADILRVLGRALTLRHVDAGSCNACELESQALSNPYYNLEGLGIRYVASPRHADALMVTGPVTMNMAVALRRTYDAMPEPKVVVAVGACAIGCGVYGPNYATIGAVSEVLPVDVTISGCPPSPTAILRGILAAITPSSVSARRPTTSRSSEAL